MKNTTATTQSYRRLSISRTKPSILSRFAFLIRKFRNFLLYNFIPFLSNVENWLLIADEKSQEKKYQNQLIEKKFGIKEVKNTRNLFVTFAAITLIISIILPLAALSIFGYITFYSNGMMFLFSFNRNSINEQAYYYGWTTSLENEWDDLQEETNEFIRNNFYATWLAYSNTFVDILLVLLSFLLPLVFGFLTYKLWTCVVPSLIQDTLISISDCHKLKMLVREEQKKVNETVSH